MPWSKSRLSHESPASGGGRSNDNPAAPPGNPRGSTAVARDNRSVLPSDAMSRPYESVLPVILAGGLGTRMRSRKAKVLHELCGRPMLAYVLAAAQETCGRR